MPWCVLLKVIFPCTLHGKGIFNVVIWYAKAIASVLPALLDLLCEQYQYFIRRVIFNSYQALTPCLIIKPVWKGSLIKPFWSPHLPPESRKQLLCQWLMGCLSVDIDCKKICFYGGLLIRYAYGLIKVDAGNPSMVFPFISLFFLCKSKY